VFFAKCGYKTGVRLWGSRWGGQHQVEVIDTASRTISALEAADRVSSQVARGIPVFKKIDSTMRGNVEAELGALHDAIRPDLMLLAPSLPSQGREVIDGRLRVDGVMQMNLLTTFQRFHVGSVGLAELATAESARARLDQAIAHKVEMVVADAETDEHLATLVESVRTLDRRTVFVGSSGLARAVADSMASHEPAPHPSTRARISQVHPRKPNEQISHINNYCLIGIGTDHPVTLGQIAYLYLHTGISPSSLADCGPQGKDLLVTLPRDLKREEVDRFLQRHLPQNFSGIILSGGDTAAMFLDFLDAIGIELCGEVLPGVPWGYVVGGVADGLPLITKSGGFGQPHTLLRCTEFLQPSLESTGGTTMTKQPKVAITVGDPAGVGAEVTLKALRDPTVSGLAEWCIIGDRIALRQAADDCSLSLEWLNTLRIVDPDALKGKAPVPGELRAEYGQAAVEYVRLATEMCLAKEADAMVTAPLNKEAVNMAGLRFSGHTEYIAELCGAKGSCMLLSNERLSVVHVSTHISLRRATELKEDRIVRAIELGNEAMMLMGKVAPRIAVCGLNPHAGEHGLFGTEDADVIVPAIEAAKAKGILCVGPTSPDTTFRDGVCGKYDLIVAMYHDQGHIPMKLIDFESTVNISLGIPIIRTSVDHGTAFDIAGKNKADPRNMIAALRAGATMAANRMAKTVAA